MARQGNRQPPFSASQVIEEPEAAPGAGADAADTFEGIESMEDVGTLAASGLSLTPILRLSRDLKAAAATLNTADVRYLVDLYYEMQEQRIRAAAQIRAAQASGEPNALLAWMLTNYETLESDIRRVMGTWTQTRREGRWLKAQVGIGPVLAAGLMAHIDLSESAARPDGVIPFVTPAHVWSFAGLNPDAKWSAGQKRPWNARLKVLCWKCGQSFVKSSGSPKSFYGPVYVARKRYEQERNEAGAYAAQAEARLSGPQRLGKETIAYSWYTQGKLPPAHIQARAERYAVKLFLAHLWSVQWDIYRGDVTRYGPKPRPYALEHLGHAEEIHPPHWPLD